MLISWPVMYCSTDAVFPEGMKNCSETDNTADYHSQLQDGYSQSKWVAEQLVHRAGQRGVPVTIYRLGNSFKLQTCVDILQAG